MASDYWVLILLGLCAIVVAFAIHAGAFRDEAEEDEHGMDQ